jgi:hypothetical protein
MVGRTRLYQRTGSPLIQGATGRRRRSVWPWLLAAVAAAALVWWYVTYLR